MPVGGCGIGVCLRDALICWPYLCRRWASQMWHLGCANKYATVTLEAQQTMSFHDKTMETYLWLDSNKWFTAAVSISTRGSALTASSRIFGCSSPKSVSGSSSSVGCLDRALAQFPLWWCQLNGVQSSYGNNFETKVELERVVITAPLCTAPRPE